MRARAGFLCGVVLGWALCGCGDDQPGSADAAVEGGSGAGGAAEDAGDRDAGDAGTDAGDGARPMECLDYEATLTNTVEQLLLIDGSASMGEPLGSSTMTRWQALREALFGDEGVITRRAPGARIGIAIYGTTPMCPLPLELIAPRPDNGAALEAAFPELPPGGQAPLGLALDALADQLAFHSPSLTNTTIITASAPTSCEAEGEPQWEAAVQAADNAFRVRHFIRMIGLDAELPLEQLQLIAAVGQGWLPEEASGIHVPIAADPSQLRELLDALVAISDCAFDMDLAVDPARACQGTVTVNGIERACEQGAWFITRPTRLQLGGEACTPFLDDPAGTTITASFPCTALEHLPGLCMTHDDCGPKHAACFRGTCVECMTDGDCEQGEACSERQCVTM